MPVPLPVIQKLNALPDGELRSALGRCCGAHKWVAQMAAARPFADAAALHASASQIWQALDAADWREAFTHHPRIGDAAALQKKFATAGWAAHEQRGTAAASDATLTALADGNRAYEERFGHIFVVCATGKTADEMLALLTARLANAPAVELPIAAAEQEKILHLRLDKLLADLS